MKSLYIFFLVMLLTNMIFPQDLPHKMSETEEYLMRTYQHPIPETDWITPPVKPVRTMAEWEELSGVIVTWTSYQSILRQIVDYAQEECIVYIVCTDSNSVRSYLTSGGVPLSNLKFILASYNSIWVRDYGPWCVYSDDADSMYIVDWIYNRPRPQDDLIPSVFAANKNYPLYQMTVAPNDVVATGGNFMTDGLGTAFSSNLILNENPTKSEAQIDTIFKKYMGIDEYIKMPTLPYDGIHHIDMHMKLLDEETLLVGQYPNGVSDGPQIEANLQYIMNNFQTKYGRPFKVIRIPMPPDASGSYPSSGGDYRTYTNSVILNKTVIVPTYAPQYDTTALRIYREAMPGYNIVGINCNQIITALGAIHCITKEIGVEEPIFISHPKILTTQNSVNGYEVKAIIKTRTGVSTATLFWSVDTLAGFNSVPMTNTIGDTFTADIPFQNLSTKVFYYISATSNSGRVISKPMTSPSGAYRFIVDSVVPVELISLNATVEMKQVILKWSTSTETNNYGFEIQRSSADQPEWKQIGFVEGNGTSVQPHSYTFTDKNLVRGKYSYRLKQIDTDGSFEFSDVVTADVTTVGNYSIEQNYPNPFNPETTIRFTVPADGIVMIKVFDIFGQEIKTLINDQRSAGEYYCTWNGTDENGNSVASGCYVYRIEAGDFSHSLKMLLMK
ncbi:MAG: agmatine deiminase family protein [Ignavibacteriales bacterium]|nr:MAG: agmatine deiminase family protein [Ignavibacteriales bacterium]